MTSIRTPKGLLLGSLLCMLGTLPGMAAAEEVAMLGVAGTIRPGACSLLLESNGVVDFGTISASSLSDTEKTALPNKTISYTVACDGPTMVAMTPLDGRLGTAAPSVSDDRGSFGLGMSGDAPLGAYTVNTSTTDSIVNGVAASPVVRTMGGNENWRTSTFVVWRDGTDQLSWATRGNTSPVALTTATQALVLKTAIAPKSDLPPLTESIPLDGLITMSLVYL